MDTNLANFPTELLEQIFSHLERANDRRRLAQVCWTFYHVVRRQSTPRCVLKLNHADPEHSAMPVFESSVVFPFSKLYIGSGIKLDPNHHFWLKNGAQIVEITIENDGLSIERFLTRWSAYFPNLRKLRIVSGLSWTARNLNQLPLSQLQSLTIEELRIETDNYDIYTIRRLQHSTPSLKRLHLAVGDAEMVPDLLGWIEKVDEVTVNAEKVPIGAIATKLALLPSKVVFTTLFVEANHLIGPRIFDEFFEKPRIVEILDVEWARYKLLIRRYSMYPLQDAQILSLLKAKSVRHLRILNGPLTCRRRLDLLAQLPGLETIKLVKLDKNGTITRRIYRFWATPSTAAKIRSIEHHPSMKISLDGLSGLTAFKCYSVSRPGWVNSQLPQPYIGEIIQGLIRQCPNLKELRLLRVDMDLLSLNSFKQLETLCIGETSKITTQSFENAFKFPKLKQLKMSCLSLNCETLDHLASNCPNLERLILIGAKIDNNGLQCLIRRLPYLMVISVQSCSHSVTNEMIRSLKMEFPYMNINISNSFKNF